MTTELANHIQEEMEFRLSLMRLMTVPHEGKSGVAPESKQMEDLSVYVPRVRRKQSAA